MGEDIYLFEHALVPFPGSTDEPSFLRAARFRQQRWEILPVSDGVGFGPALVAGSRIVFPQLGCSDGSEIDGYTGYGRCIDLGGIFATEADTWHELPNPPGRGPQYIGSSGACSDGSLLLPSPGNPALDLVTNEWFTVPSLYVDRIVQRHVQAAGPYGFAFGGSDGAGQLLIDTWIWKP